MTPKATIKQEKKDKVETLTQELSNAKSAVFVDYQGMNVALVGDFRAKVREVGGKMLVAKNTLIQIAAKNAEYPEDSYSDEVLSGQTAVVLGYDDAVAPIQILGKFAKENEKPTIRAGVVDNNFYALDGIMKISTLPSKEELQAKVVGAVGAPLYGLIGTLNANLQNLVFTLGAIRDQKK